MSNKAILCRIPSRLIFIVFALLLGHPLTVNAKPTEQPLIVKTKRLQEQEIDIDSSKIFHHTHFYRITSKEIPAPSYLYGLRHIEENCFKLPPQVIPCLDETTQLVTECDYNKQEHKAFQYEIQKTFLSFYQQMGKEKLPYTSPFFEYLASQQNEDNRHMIYPSSPLLSLYGLHQGGLRYPEQMLYEYYTKEGKRIRGLEPPSENIFSAKKLSAGKIRNMIKTEENETVQVYYAQLADYWFNGSRDHALWEGQNEECKLAFSIKGDVTRHYEWLSQMSVMLPQAPSLFAVGTMHLVGKKGLVKELLNQNYTLNRIDATGQATPVTEANYHLPFVKDITYIHPEDEDYTPHHINATKLPLGYRNQLSFAFRKGYRLFRKIFIR